MLDAPASTTDGAETPAHARWRRRWQRAQALGPAYFQVAVRWIGWGLALFIIMVSGEVPADSREPAGPFLVMTLGQTILFTIYYPVMHHWIRPLLRRSGLHRREGSALWAATDILLSIVAVAGTGGSRSPFFTYTLTSVMFPALVFRWRGAMAAATAFGLLYLAVVAFSGEGIAGVLRAGQLGSFVTAFVDAYLIALFSAYLADLVHRVEVERRRTAAISRETRALYAVAQGVLESPPEGEALYEHTVAAVRRHLSLPSFGVYTIAGPTARLSAGYGVAEALPVVALRAVANGGEEGAESAKAGRLLVAAPLRVGDQTLAWLVAGHRPGAAAPTEALLQALAGQLSLGLRNAALAREKADLAAAGERERLAREIHDGVAQSLYMLTLNLEACAELAAAPPAPMPAARHTASAAPPLSTLAARLDQLLGLARQALWEVRHYIFDLKPLLGGEAPLTEVLRNPLREFQTIAGLPAELRTDGAERPLSPRARAAVYRVLQEGLANAFKHAQATRVDVALRWESGGLVLEVRDDGRGFDPDVDRRGHGLENILARAAEAGGRAAMYSKTGAGTRVELFVPYADRVPEAS